MHIRINHGLKCHLRAHPADTNPRDSNCSSSMSHWILDYNPDQLYKQARGRRYQPKLAAESRLLFLQSRGV